LTDAPGLNSKQATVTFVNAAGGDFHIDETDEEAIGFGTDLSGHGTYPITRDIDGQTRTSLVCGPDWLATGPDPSDVEVTSAYPQFTMSANIVTNVSEVEVILLYPQYTLSARIGDISVARGSNMGKRMGINIGIGI
jgi:hypothetical protein